MRTNEINDKTRVPLFVAVIVAIFVIGLATGGGIWAYEVRRDISDIKEFMDGNVSRDEFRNWSKDFKIANPTLIVPELEERRRVNTGKDLPPIAMAPIGVGAWQGISDDKKTHLHIR